MANDKDFKVKNGVKASAYYEAIGTATSSAVNYNPPATSAGFDSFSATAQVSQNGGIAIGNSNAKLYLGDLSGQRIYQYSLSPADDLSSASYDSRSLSVSARTGISLHGITFKPDGTKVVFCGSNITPGGVFSYSLSTAWDIQSGTYDGNTNGRLDSYSDDTTPNDVAFNDDGTKLYVCGGNGDSIYEYTLSSAYVVGTGSLNHTFSVASQATTPTGVDFNADGTKMFVACSATNLVYTYNLSTGFDLSTASYSGESGYFGVGDTGLSFNSDGSKYYVFHTNETAYSIPSTLTRQTLDLSTGSVFNLTATDDTEIKFSNPAPSGTVSSATLILNGGSKTTYDIANLKGSGEQAKIGTLGAQFITSATSYLRGVFIGKNGSRMYVSDINDDFIYQYNILRPPYLDSAVIAGIVDAGNTTGTEPRSIFFKPDGTKMYQIDVANDGVYQWDLSTAWEISSAVYNSKQLSIASQTTAGDGLWFKTDGTSAYVLDKPTGDVFQYDLTTAWDISTASYASKTIAEASNTDAGIIFNDDGTKIFIGSDLKEYDLSTAWDISTGTASGSTAGGSIDRYANKLTLTASGGKYFYLGNRTTRAPNRVNDPLREQKVARLYFGTPYSISYDSSVKFQRGSTRSAFNIGETRVITFTTRDGGTTYMAQEVMKGIDDDV